jgi:cytochrome c553
MSPAPAAPRRDAWLVRSVAVTAAIFVVSAVVGFIVLPLAQPDLRLAGIWDAICSAAGVAAEPSKTTPVEPAYKLSSVVMTPDMLDSQDAQSIGRGATLAHQCAICHGPAGISRADSPTLSGQYAAAIYKQLQDFKTGARVNAIMTPFAEHLSEQDMVDIAAYYAYRPRRPGPRPATGRPPPRIVINGAPMRGIAPCGSCHGDLDNKAGSPWLGGQSAVYFRDQLQAFATGERRNDINQQMRNIARQMTPAEIEAAALYYAGEPASVERLPPR